MRRVGNLWAIGFVYLGLCALIGHIALATGFAVAGERMTRTLRTMAFKSMVSESSAFFPVAAGRTKKEKMRNWGGGGSSRLVRRFYCCQKNREKQNGEEAGLQG